MTLGSLQPALLLHMAARSSHGRVKPTNAKDVGHFECIRDLEEKKVMEKSPGMGS